MNIFEMESCCERLELYLLGILQHVGRSDRRKWGGVYVRGLLLDGHRKSAGAMAQRLPDGNEQSLHNFVNDAPWDAEIVQKAIAQRVVPEMGGPGMWLFDDTGFPKKGKHSVGVHRQYSGTLGKVGNCQIGVSMSYATATASMPLTWQLYLPEVWAQDQERRKMVGVPAEVTFKTKWEIAIDLIKRVRSWGLPDQIVNTDAGYGHSNDFRDELEQLQLQYIVGVTEEMVVWVGEVPALPPPPPGATGRPPCRWNYGENKPKSLLEVAKSLPASAWQQVTWAQGSKGPLRSRFAVLRCHVAHGWAKGKAPRPERWVLIEWPEGVEKPDHYWVSNLSEAIELTELVRLAKLRWRIEQDYEQLKDELGLDHFEGRSWGGWHRHVTMVTMAYGFLVLERLRAQKNGS